jgi:energy-coupling factor transport system permease protein
MKNVTIGQYIPGHSYLYKLDPRTKITALMILMISTFILQDIMHILILLGVTVVILLSGSISVIRVFKGLRPIMFLLMFTFFFQILFVKTGDVLYDINLNITLYNILVFIGIFALYYFTKRLVPFKLLYFIGFIVASGYVLSNFNLGYQLTNPWSILIYKDGVIAATFVMIRLIIIVTLSTILTLTTKPTDLTLGLEKLLRPLSVIRINAEEVALIISLALRYIPTLLDEANKIMLAQASRGVDFNEGKIKDKVTQIISLLVPMFIISFNRSDDLANAMEARSFVPGKPRTRLHVLKWKAIDTTTIAFSLLVMTISIVVVAI